MMVFRELKKRIPSQLPERTKLDQVRYSLVINGEHSVTSVLTEHAALPSFSSLLCSLSGGRAVRGAGDHLVLFNVSL